MKKYLLALSVLLATFMLFGCVGKTDNSSAINTQPTNKENTKTGTLQGKIMDALTGAALGGNDLKVYLVQGNDNRGPSKLNRDGDLMGEYSFSSIPIDLYTGNATFKVVVIKSGYQRFEANVELNANTTGLVNQTFDSVINMIGNIYLFPEGTMAGDVKIYVYDPSGLPIQDATVKVYQDVQNNSAWAPGAVSTSNSNSQSGLNPNNDRLAPTGGLYTSMSYTTDSTGMATISGTQLVLGGRYSVVVAEMQFNGQLLNDSSSSFTVSTVNIPVIFNLTNHAPASLFATAASNQVPGTITAGGVLTVTFNQPILLSTTTFGAVLSSSGTLTAPLATGALSNGNTVLTITPNFATAPSTTDAGASITYSYGGTIYLEHTQTNSGRTLFTGGVNDVINISTGGKVSGMVMMISH